MSLQIGGITYPLPAPGNGRSLLTVADPFTAKALSYWQACLNQYFAAAFDAAMGGQASDPIDMRACVETGNVDPSAFTIQTTYKLPYLAMWPVSMTSNRRTIRWNQVETTYRAAYVLPNATADMAQQASLPLLTAAYKLIRLVTEAQSDPAYNGGESVWFVAGTEYVNVTDATVGFTPNDDRHVMFPMLSFGVVSGDLQKADQDKPVYVGADHHIDQPDPGPLGLLADVVVIKTDVG